MRTSDLMREVFFPMFVTGLVASVWCVAYNRSSAAQEPPQYWPAADPDLMRKALAADPDNAPTTRPVDSNSATASINPAS